METFLGWSTEMYVYLRNCSALKSVVQITAFADFDDGNRVEADGNYLIRGSFRAAEIPCASYFNGRQGCGCARLRLRA